MKMYFLQFKCLHERVVDKVGSKRHVGHRFQEGRTNSDVALRDFLELK